MDFGQLSLATGDVRCAVNLLNRLIAAVRPTLNNDDATQLSISHNLFSVCRFALAWLQKTSARFITSELPNLFSMSGRRRNPLHFPPPNAPPTSALGAFNPVALSDEQRDAQRLLSETGDSIRRNWLAARPAKTQKQYEPR